jgi:hypothetical protein
LHCDCIAFNTIAKGIRKTITGKKKYLLKKTNCTVQKEEGAHDIWKLEEENNETATIRAHTITKSSFINLLLSYVSQLKHYRSLITALGLIVSKSNYLRTSSFEIKI